MTRQHHLSHLPIQHPDIQVDSLLQTSPFILQTHFYGLQILLILAEPKVLVIGDLLIRVNGIS